MGSALASAVVLGIAAETATIIAASIGAGVSLAVSIWSAGRTRALEQQKLISQEDLEDRKLASQHDLEELRQSGESRLAQLTTALDEAKAARLAALTSQLDDSKGERAARRDYLYEARKHLYTNAEPLFFQLNEVSEDARQRVFSLARSSRHGRLGGPSSHGDWLRGNPYYLRSTAYYLFTPMVFYPLIQRRLTAVDLNLEPRVEALHRLVKVLHWSFSEGHDLAQEPPPVGGLPYDPHYDGQVGDPEAIYRLQGLAFGEIAQISEAFIVEDGASAPPRNMSYGEFFSKVDSSPPFAERVEPLIQLLTGFHPASHPILWRILAYQVLIYEAIMRIHRRPGVDPEALGSVILDDSVHRARLSYEEDKELQPMFARAPFEAALRTLEKRLHDLTNPLG